MKTSVPLKLRGLEASTRRLGAKAKRILPLREELAAFVVRSLSFAARRKFCLRNLALQMEADKKCSCDFLPEPAGSPALHPAVTGGVAVGAHPPPKKSLSFCFPALFAPWLRASSRVRVSPKAGRNVNVDLTAADLGKQILPPLPLLPQTSETRVVSLKGSG